MPNIRSISIEDQGVNWRVEYEYQRTQPPYDWATFAANFPADFGDINPDDVQGAMLELAFMVAKGQGVHE